MSKPRSWLAGAAGVALLGLAGCTAPKTSARATPSGVTPGVVALTVGDFSDTDQNRYRDTTTVSVYIYASSSAYPIPMRVRGRFEFELRAGKGQILKQWSFDEKQTAAALREMAPGPGFIFELSLVGADRLDGIEAEVLCTFLPAEGAPIRARSVAAVAIGPITRPRSSN